jgi:hypothetical protein
MPGGVGGMAGAILSSRPDSPLSFGEIVADDEPFDCVVITSNVFS